MDMIRCPSCKGMKSVPKLGGMIGECNVCLGKGKIAECDKPKPVVVEPEEAVAPVIDAVANSVVASTVDREVDSVSLDAKRAIYKRKSG